MNPHNIPAWEITNSAMWKHLDMLLNACVIDNDL
jgi:hypothetical protein